MTAARRQEVRRLVPVILGFALLAGCAGARVTITAKTAAYPISLAFAVGDRQGKVWDPASLVKVGTFSVRRTRLGFFYAGITPRDTWDVSDDVNAQVGSAAGEAIVGLAVTIAGSCNGLNGFPILNVLPFWPGCVPIHITGDIVRRRL